MSKRAFWMVFLMLLVVGLASAQQTTVIDHKGTKKTVTNNQVTTAATAPTGPVEGDVWFDTTTNISKIYDGSVWKTIDPDAVSVTTTAPTTPVEGDIWFDSTNNLTKVWDGSAWQSIQADTAFSLWDKDTDTGIQVEESADEDKIRFDTAGTERMIIDESGNVGMGTDAPSQRLDVDGQARVRTLNAGVAADELVVADATGVLKKRPLADVEFVNGHLEEVGRVKADAEGFYSFADEECGNITVIRADEANYFANEAVVSGEDGGVVKTDIPLDLRKMVIAPKKDLAIFLNPIYFDLDKSYIRPDAEIELEKIITIMNQHPTIEIDVRSHTDSRASDAYNMALSERRAQSTINYLIEHGISSYRLTGRGYGESELVNHCSNGVKCPDYVHEQNRRSEFIITKQ